ncbi:MAG: hypothetical protein NTX63_02270 [Candidatus Peregrinibacteria bacterium]|nr:hypothetical protein [Candidatus Peregrinibacteria bacterium]
MANEQNTDGAFDLNQNLANQLPEMPQGAAQETTVQQVVGTPVGQIQYASSDVVPQAIPQAVRYVAPTAANQASSYAFGANASVSNPNSMVGKLKSFFAKPLGKIMLFTVLFLGVAGLIMYSTSSVGLKGSFIDQTTGAKVFAVGDKVLGNWESNANAWSPATITKVNTDGTYDIHYDDGTDKTSRTKKQLADMAQHPTEVKIGQIIVYKHPTKDEWYNGLVIGDESGNPTLIQIVGAAADDTSVNKPIAVDLNSAYLTLDGYKEIGNEVFTGSAPVSSNNLITLTTLPNYTGIMASLGVTAGATTTAGANKPPLAPAWTAPAPNADIALADLAKTEFKWTPGVDADQGPSKTPNYEFAIIKGAVMDQTEMGKVFTSTGDEISKKYDFAWVVAWTEKTALDEMQKLIGATNCVADIGDGKVDYTCNKFVIPPNVLAQMKEGEKFTAIVQQGDGAAGSPYAAITFTIKKPANKPPLTPAWTAPAPNADIALADLAKTEFKWTPGVDADQGPSKTPNYQFAIVKGELADQAEITKIFTDTDASANKKYDFVWITRWTEKAAQEEMQKLIGATNCIADIGGGNTSYICEKFMIPSNVLAQMKEGQKFTAIVQQGDGAVGSPYATTIFSVKKAEDCPVDQYYIKDSKNSGCKKIPNFKGAFTQAGFICGLYKTILGNPDNAYHLSSDTKATLQTNIESQCSKKPDAVTNTCLTKMTYVPEGKALCEPLKIITDPALSQDVCDQYIAEKDNKSLSADTTKQIATIMGVQCKPKICPTGKFLNGSLVPDDCESILSFPTKFSPYNVAKSCETMKAIAVSTDALSTYQIDQSTLDQIKAVATSDGCSPTLPAANDASKTADTTTTTTATTDTKTVVTAATACDKGMYLAGTSIATDCKKLPDLMMLTSISDISSACQLYKDLTSGKIDGKMDAATALQAKDFSVNVLCDQTISPTPPVSTNDSAPPSLTFQPPVKTVVQSQPQNTQANVLGSLPISTTPASSSVTQTAPTPVLSAAASTTPKSYEALPANQTMNYQPALPVAGSYIPRTTAKTGPEMWIYSFGLAFATIGSRKWKHKKK